MPDYLIENTDTGALEKVSATNPYVIATGRTAGTYRPYVLSDPGSSVLVSTVVPTLDLSISPPRPLPGDTVTVTGNVGGVPVPTVFLAIGATIGGSPVTLSGEGLSRTFTAAAGTLVITASVGTSAGNAADTLTEELVAFGILNDQWFTLEAVADADTRKTFAQAQVPTLPGGKKLSVYRGSTPPPDDATVAALADMVTTAAPVYTWTSSGVSPVGGTVYVRIALRNTDGSGAVWATSTKTFNVSHRPLAPSVSATPAVGGSNIVITGLDGRGRSVDSGETRLDGGSYVAMPNLSGFFIAHADALVHQLELRVTNENGTSDVTTLGVVATGTVVSTFAISTPNATARIGDNLSITFPTNLPAGQVFGATYLQSRRGDRTAFADEWFTRKIDGPANSEPLSTKFLGCQIRVKAAIHDAAGDFVEWRLSNVLGPVQYDAAFLTGATNIALNDWTALNTAKANNAITMIALAPGIWDTSGANATALQGRDRSVAPLTICSQDPVNRATASHGWYIQGSNSLTLVGLSADCNRNGSLCYAFTSSINCTIDAPWGTNGPRWTRDQILNTPAGINGDDIWGLFMKPAGAFRGLVFKNGFSEFCNQWAAFSNSNAQGVFTGCFHNVWWDDFINYGGQFSATSSARPSDDIVLDDIISMNLIGIGEEGPGRSPHSDLFQFTNLKTGKIRLSRICYVINPTRSLTQARPADKPSPQGFFSSGEGAFEVEVLSFCATYNLPNAFSFSAHNRMRVENVTMSKLNPNARDGSIGYGYPSNRRWGDGFGFDLRTMVGFMAPTATSTDSFVAGYHEPVKFDLGAGNYFYDEVGDTFPYRTLTGDATYMVENPEEWMQFHRPLPAYTAFGAVTAEGYVKPISARLAPPVVTAARSTPNTTVNVSWTAVTGATSYIARYRRNTAEKFWEAGYYLGTGLSTTFTKVGAEYLQELEVEVFAVTAAGIVGTGGKVTVAGVNNAPSVSIQATRNMSDPVAAGDPSYPFYDFDLNPKGWPQPVITITSATFNSANLPRVTNGGGRSAATIGQFSKHSQFNAKYRSWAVGNGHIVFTGTVSNSVATVPFSIDYAVTDTAPATIITGSVAPVTTGGVTGQISINVTNASFGEFDSELCYQLDSRPVVVLATPPEAGTFLLTTDQGVIPGVDQLVKVFVRNPIGNGPMLSRTVKSVGGTTAVVFSDRFTGSRSPQATLASGDTLQTVTPLLGSGWTRALGTSGIDMAMHSTLRGMRVTGGSGLQYATYRTNNDLVSVSEYALATFDFASVLSSCSARLLLRVSADGLFALGATIAGSQVSLTYLSAADTSTTLGTAVNHGLTVGSVNTIRLEIRPNDQRLILNGNLVCSASAADAAIPSLGTYGGLRNRINSGQTQNAPGGVLWRTAEFGTL